MERIWYPKFWAPYSRKNHSEMKINGWFFILIFCSEVKLYSFKIVFFPVEHVRGDPVVFNKNYTYVVHILYWFEPTIVSSCTGSAIRHNVILSAAHCFVNSTQKEINTDNVLLTVLGTKKSEKLYNIPSGILILISS